MCQYTDGIILRPCLVGGIPPPLKSIKVNWDDSSQLNGTDSTCSKPPSSCGILWHHSCDQGSSQDTILGSWAETNKSRDGVSQKHGEFKPYLRKIYHRDIIIWVTHLKHFKAMDARHSRNFHFHMVMHSMCWGYTHACRKHTMLKHIHQFHWQVQVPRNLLRGIHNFWISVIIPARKGR